MISLYSKTFASLKKRRLLGFCPFAVLGDPNEKKTLERVKKYIKAGADFLELGIPFSDPIADGPTIQAADERAIKAGMTPKKAIALIKKIRTLSLRGGRRPTKQSSPDGVAKACHDNKIPIGILTYSNIVLRYGIEKFYRDIAAAGTDSVLIADVPLEEIAPFAASARRHKLAQIMLVSDYTDTARLKKIEKIASGGFLYVVSTLGVTGTRKKLNTKVLSLIRSLKKKTKMPLMIGFGISSPEHIKALKKAGADGAIVGSALVKTPLKNLHYKINALMKSSRAPLSS